MSYILDALRRAESERERGQVPGLHTQPVPVGLGDGQGARKGARGRIAALAAGVLVMLGAGVWWWSSRTSAEPPRLGEGSAAQGGPSEPGGPAGAGTAPVTAPSPGSVGGPPAGMTAPPAGAVAAAGPPLLVAPPAPPAPRAPPAQPAPPPRPERAAAPAATPPQRARQTSAPGAAEAPAVPPAPAPLPVPAQAAAPAPPARSAPQTSASPVTPPPAAAAGPAGGGAPAKPTLLADLPPAQRAELPQMLIGGSIYSDQPSSRFVVINGLVVREGETAAPGVVLERIGSKAATVRWREMRIELPL